MGTGLAGCAIGAALIHPAFRDPLRLYSEARSEKLYLLEHAPDTMTAAAFGSSRTHDAFDPATFDAELAAHGHEVRSLNLAIYGGSQTEERAIARRFLQRESCGISASTDNKNSQCLMIFEYSAGANLQPENLINPRAINLYDVDTAKFAMEYSGPEAGRLQRLGRAAYGVAGSLLNALNVGMLSNAIFRPPLNQKLLTNYTMNDRRGRAVSNINHDAPDVVDAFRKYSATPATADAARVPPGAYKLLEDTTRFGAGRQLRYFYFVSPTLASLQQTQQLPCVLEGRSGQVPIFNLDRPDQYPELFIPAMWHDFGHLNDQGALLFSKLLAKQIDAWLDGVPPAGCGG